MCEYCLNAERLKQESPIYDFHPQTTVLKDGRLSAHYEKIVKNSNIVTIKTYYKINYCPMCGRKLKGETK